MRRRPLSHRIAEAEEHVRRGEAMIARQRSVVADLHSRARRSNPGTANTRSLREESGFARRASG